MSLHQHGLIINYKECIILIRVLTELDINADVLGEIIKHAKLFLYYQDDHLQEPYWRKSDFTSSVIKRIYSKYNSSNFLYFHADNDCTLFQNKCRDSYNSNLSNVIWWSCVEMRVFAFILLKRQVLYFVLCIKL